MATDTILLCSRSRMVAKNLSRIDITSFLSQRREGAKKEKGEKLANCAFARDLKFLDLRFQISD